ncbi:MAG: hypothetical protein A3H97_03675 [Acidobacteria bacterium RIFCSPLOWO2_02_FULL_65_29]|nr:MAG: hypothetical protein A3H97_03675 [Acidobacteria bacterium RIFCSPLOWO2_02_FULL_65_29]
MSFSLSAVKGRALRVNNVSRRFGVPERTVRYWAETGRLAGFRLTPKIWGFYAADVEAFRLKRGLAPRVA